MEDTRTPAPDTSGLAIDREATLIATEAWLAEGHCVNWMETLHRDELIVVCSCRMLVDADTYADYVDNDTYTCVVATMHEAEAWSAEHRRQFDLAPQAMVPHSMYFVAVLERAEPTTPKHARVQIGANGHEVWLGHDVLADGTHEWYAYCSCADNGITRDGTTLVAPDPASGLPSYEVAVQVAAKHAAAHGGAWEPGHPDPDLPAPPL